MDTRSTDSSTPPPPPEPELRFAGHEGVFLERSEQRRTLWRYMDLAKFVSLLSTRALFLTRADRFEDPFEGSVPRARVEARAQARREQQRRHGRVMLTAHEPVFVEDAILNTVVNCWYSNEHESDAMWKLYAPGGQGVAICSSYAGLAKSLPQTKAKIPEHAISGWAKLLRLRILPVQYIDYDAHPNAWDEPFLLKRPGFEHEREVRLFAQDRTSLQGDPRAHLPIELRSRFPLGGCAVPIDLRRLIERVVVPPSSPPWFSAVVADLLRRYEVDVEVRPSTLAARPLH